MNLLNLWWMVGVPVILLYATTPFYLTTDDSVRRKIHIPKNWDDPTEDGFVFTMNALVDDSDLGALFGISVAIGVFWPIVIVAVAGFLVYAMLRKLYGIEN